MYPFLTFSENRHLREAIYKGYVNKGKNKNSNNNEKILLEITNLREQRAKILGFDSHTELALQNTMAESKKNVLELLDNVWGPATKRAQDEIKEIIKETVASAKTKAVEQVGLKLIKFCAKWDLQRIAEYPQSYAEPLNAKYKKEEVMA